RQHLLHQGAGIEQAQALARALGALLNADEHAETGRINPFHPGEIEHEHAGAHRLGGAFQGLCGAAQDEPALASQDGGVVRVMNSDVQQVLTLALYTDYYAQYSTLVSKLFHPYCSDT